MASSDGEDVVQELEGRLKAITWPAGTPIEPPPYEQNSDEEPTDMRPGVKAAGKRSQNAPSRRETEGATLIHALTKNKKDMLYKHLFNGISVTSEYNPTGTVTSERVDVVWNRDRIQCVWCDKWFASKPARDIHNRDYGSGCGTHRKCFGKHYNVMHAKHHEHDRCFVGGCGSEFREEDGWTNEEIEKHVRKAHGLEGKRS